MKKPEKKPADKKTSSLPPKKQTNNVKLLTLLILLAFLAIGISQFFYQDGPANMKRIYYGYVVRQAYAGEYANLQSVLVPLGINNKNSVKSSCKVTRIATDGIHTKDLLLCGIQSDNFVKISPANKSTIDEAAIQLDGLVVAHGGVMSTNSVPTFGKYFADISNGVDYYPDISATFVRDNYLCSVHVYIAYARPSTPAYYIQFGCNSPRVTNDNFYLAPP